MSGCCCTICTVDCPGHMFQSLAFREIMLQLLVVQGLVPQLVESGFPSDSFRIDFRSFDQHHPALWLCGVGDSHHYREWVYCGYGHIYNTLVAVWESATRAGGGVTVDLSPLHIWMILIFIATLWCPFNIPLQRITMCGWVVMSSSSNNKNNNQSIRKDNNNNNNSIICV